MKHVECVFFGASFTIIVYIVIFTADSNLCGSSYRCVAKRMSAGGREELRGLMGR